MQRALRFVLASASPARLALLRAAGFDPEVLPSDVDEDGIEGLAPADAARSLAVRKAEAVARRLTAEGTDSADSPDDARSPIVVVGCDSLLAIDGELRGKPESAEQARAWWHGQRGRTGSLVTGHCVAALRPGGDARSVAASATTLVRFGCPSDAEIDAYIATGEPLQVAGAATIDGYGAPFVAGIDGDHGTVLGLSLPLLRDLLAQLDVAITDLWVRR